MKNTNRSIAFILLFLLFFGCAPFENSKAFKDQVATHVQETTQALQASADLMDKIVLPAVVETLPVMTSTSLPAPQSSDPCLQALLVKENVPDGTVLSAGEAFTKTWWLRNTGSCSWSSNYQLVFSRGDQMRGNSSVKLNGTVPPGEQIAISVDLKAPEQAGTHTGYWRMRSDKGVQFAQIWTRIQVSSSAAATKAPTTKPKFKVTDVQVAVSQDSVTGLDPCPVDITIQVDVTANGAGEVELEWDSADTMGCGLCKNFLTFNAPGTQTIQETCSGIGPGPFEYIILIHAYSGNRLSRSGEYLVQCVE